MNEKAMEENELKEEATGYEAPEILELGRAGDLTNMKGDDWPDGLNRYIFVP